MEIPVPNSFENDFDVFDSVADIQNKICLAEETEIKISLPHADLFRNRIRLFLLTCLNAFGAQKDKNIVFRCNFPSYAFDERNLATLFQLHTKDDVVQIVSANISKRIPVQMTENVEDRLVSLIGEVYNNAVEHSESEYIIGNCYNEAQNDEDVSRMCFYCYDAGIGIIESVRRYLKKENDVRFHEYDINSRLLKWALKKGNTTKQPPRGVGIEWLLNFAKANSGYVRICNENVLFEQNTAGKITYQKLNNNFWGLFFEMHIMEAPNVIYRLKGE